MAKIAIDIALIPPNNIIEIIEKISENANLKGQAEHLMGKNDFIPHISLSMGCIEESKVNKISNTISEIAENFGPIKIELTDLEYFTSSEGKRTYWLSIKENKRLQELHEIILDKIEKFLSYEPSVEMYYKKEGEEVKKVPEGIPLFKEKNRKDYDPHVTLLVNETDFNDLPINFTASRVVLCHAGVRTSCRKILFETRLYIK